MPRRRGMMMWSVVQPLAMIAPATVAAAGHNEFELRTQLALPTCSS